jgi:D-alanine--(R)-lactate ligase
VKRLTIAIVFGGCSEEHDVSVKSAMEVADALDTRKYEPVYVGITRAGAWKTCDRPSPAWEVGDGPRAVLSPDRSTHGVLVFEGDDVRTMHVDVVVPVLHGTSGEDGAVQGLLELSGIPYVGCGIQTSVTCMDKSLAYVVARSAGIDTPEFRVVLETETAAPPDLTFPVFVKPARSGSSFGVTKVERARQWDAALAEARRYDRKVVVEDAVVGTEVGCAVLGSGDELRVGAVDQITLRHGFFRIHQEATPERGSENAVVEVPAAVAEVERARIREMAMSIYRALGCEGLARVDMFLRADGRILLNEVNTLPGFTAYSRYPRMMAAAGISLAEVIDRAITLAIAR